MGGAYAQHLVTPQVLLKPYSGLEPLFFFSFYAAAATQRTSRLVHQGYWETAQHRHRSCSHCSQGLTQTSGQEDNTQL